MARTASPAGLLSRRRLLTGVGATLAFPSTSFETRTALAAEGPVIAAAASLRPALEVIAPVFQRGTGKSVRISYGATGTLVRQIELGGPFEAFLSADEESVTRLEGKGLTDGASRVLVRGRIVLAVPKGSPIAVDEAMAGLAQVLALPSSGGGSGGALRRFAIANPDLAPYGRAAREALQRAGLWDQVSIRLVVAENVGQAAQYVASGAAQAGIIALASALAPEVGPAISYVRLPEDRHSAINQRMAVLKGAGLDARAFLAFLQTADARTLFERSGFAVP